MYPNNRKGRTQLYLAHFCLFDLGGSSDNLESLGLSRIGISDSDVVTTYESGAVVDLEPGACWVRRDVGVVQLAFRGTV